VRTSPFVLTPHFGTQFHVKLPKASASSPHTEDSSSTGPELTEVEREAQEALIQERYRATRKLGKLVRRGLLEKIPHYIVATEDRLTLLVQDPIPPEKRAAILHRLKQLSQNLPPTLTNKENDSTQIKVDDSPIESEKQLKNKSLLSASYGLGQRNREVALLEPGQRDWQEYGWAIQQKVPCAPFSGLAGENPKPVLSVQQVKILQGIMAHQPDPDIMDEVGLAVGSQKTQVAQLLMKLGFASRFEILQAARARKNSDFVAERDYKAIGLTKGQAAVLHGLIEGHSNEEIAQNLYLTVDTVKTVIANIGKRLGLPKNRRELIADTALEKWRQYIEPLRPSPYRRAYRALPFGVLLTEKQYKVHQALMEENGNHSFAKSRLRMDSDLFNYYTRILPEAYIKAKQPVPPQIEREFSPVKRSYDDLPTGLKLTERQYKVHQALMNTNGDYSSSKEYLSMTSGVFDHYTQALSEAYRRANQPIPSQIQKVLSDIKKRQDSLPSGVRLTEKQYKVHQALMEANGDYVAVREALGFSKNLFNIFTIMIFKSYSKARETLPPQIAKARPQSNKSYDDLPPGVLLTENQYKVHQALMEANGDYSAARDSLKMEPSLFSDFVTKISKSYSKAKQPIPPQIIGAKPRVKRSFEGLPEDVLLTDKQYSVYQALMETEGDRSLARRKVRMSSELFDYYMQALTRIFAEANQPIPDQITRPRIKENKNSQTLSQAVLSLAEQMFPEEAQHLPPLYAENNQDLSPRTESTQSHTTKRFSTRPRRQYPDLPEGVQLTATQYELYQQLQEVQGDRQELARRTGKRSDKLLETTRLIQKAFEEANQPTPAEIEQALEGQRRQYPDLPAGVLLTETQYELYQQLQEANGDRLGLARQTGKLSHGLLKSVRLIQKVFEEANQPTPFEIEKALEGQQQQYSDLPTGVRLTENQYQLYQQLLAVKGDRYALARQLSRPSGKLLKPLRLIHKAFEEANQPVPSEVVRACQIPDESMLHQALIKHSGNTAKVQEELGLSPKAFNLIYTQLLKKLEASNQSIPWENSQTVQ
jgi:DNA-binding NarL/FixJ family response regulator